MPDDLYINYRLLDRLMSANPSVKQHVILGMRSVDQGNCRQLIGNRELCNLASELPDVERNDNFLIWALQVASVNNGRPNAYASSYNNRITIGKSLDKAFGSNYAAKACVIAHELAHLEKDHSKSEKQALSQWNNIASAKIQSATWNAQRVQKSRNFWSAVAMVTNAVSAGLNSYAGNYAQASLSNLNNRILATNIAVDAAQGQNMIIQIMQSAQEGAPQIYQALGQLNGLSASLVERTMRDVNRYLGEVNANAAKLSREHENEADTMAAGYLANAGIDPKGFIDMVNLLHRGDYRPLAQSLDSHPGESERLASLQEAVEANLKIYKKALALPSVNRPLSYQYDERQDLVSIYPRNMLITATSDPMTVDRFLHDQDAARRDSFVRTSRPFSRIPHSVETVGYGSVNPSVPTQVENAYQRWQRERELAVQRYADMVRQQENSGR